MENSKFRKLTALLAGFVLVSSMTTAAFAETGQTTDVNVEILPGPLEIFAPSVIDFGTIEANNDTWVVVIDVWGIAWVNVTWSTISWAYFWVLDLKWTPAWYYVTLDSADLILGSDNNVKIVSDNIKMILTWTWGSWAGPLQGWIFLLDWELPEEVQAPEFPEAVFDSPTIISRNWPTTPAVWRLWMYGLQPIFKIYVPKYQQLWEYTSTFTLTIIEN